MTTELFVIKALKRGVWYYYTSIEAREREWDLDLYIAKRFKSYKEAETYLHQAFKTKHWGGYFEIARYYVNG
jgi:hypothetical protein